MLVVLVPPGTQVERWDGGRIDLVRPGQEVTLARGGPGGRGNKRFVTAVRQAPRLAEKGLPGEEGEVDLHLKLLADVGLVGLPNVGKSSLLARMTRAQPKVAAYPFTTLEPVLGTIDADDRQLVIADIPGLIEGASAGAGLGHDFLAHVERTRLLVHVLDLVPLDASRSGRRTRGDSSVNWPSTIRGSAALPRLLALQQGRSRRRRRFTKQAAGGAGASVWRSQSSSTSSANWREAWASCVASCRRACRCGEPIPEAAGEELRGRLRRLCGRPMSHDFDVSRQSLSTGTWIVSGESVQRETFHAGGISRTRRRRPTLSGG